MGGESFIRFPFPKARIPKHLQVTHSNSRREGQAATPAAAASPSASLSFPRVSSSPPAPPPAPLSPQPPPRQPAFRCPRSTGGDSGGTRGCGGDGCGPNPALACGARRDAAPAVPPWTWRPGAGGLPRAREHTNTLTPTSPRPAGARQFTLTRTFARGLARATHTRRQAHTGVREPKLDGGVPQG